MHFENKSTVKIILTANDYNTIFKLWGLLLIPNTPHVLYLQNFLIIKEPIQYNTVVTHRNIMQCAWQLCKKMDKIFWSSTEYNLCQDEFSYTAKSGQLMASMQCPSSKHQTQLDFTAHLFLYSKNHLSCWGKYNAAYLLQHSGVEHIFLPSSGRP